MTKSKGERLVQELIAKYGDAAIVVSYDYYASMIIIDGDTKRKDESECVLKEIRLSDIGYARNRDHYKTLEAIASGAARVSRQPIIVEESKALYESEEQKELRRKESESMSRFLSRSIFGSELMRDTLKVCESVARLERRGLSPKEFGEAYANVNKKK